MRIIRTQADFDAVVASTPTDQVIQIYPRDTGAPYELSAPWELPSNTYIRGVALPKIRYTGTNPVTTVGMLSMLGSSAVKKVNIRIKGLHLIGNPTFGNLRAIGATYCGSTSTTGANSGTYSRHNSATVGKDMENLVGFRLEQCLIEDWNWGVVVSLVHNSQLVGNTIRNSAGIGLFLNSTRSVSVEGNTVQGSASAGIMAQNSAGMSMTGNGVKDNGANGVQLNSVSHSTLHGNTVDGNGDTGISLGSSSHFNSVTGNTSRNNAVTGIYLSASSYNAVTGNTVKENGEYGIYLASAIKNAVTGNTVHDNTVIGIREDSLDNTVSGNAVTGHETDVALIAGSNGVLYGNVYGVLTNAGTATASSNVVTT